jgi:predicted dehydrogenase
MSRRPISRRNFLRKAGTAAGAAIGFPYIIPASALGADGRAAPSSRIALGFIGLGDQGRDTNLKVFGEQPDVQVVALCDVDKDRIRKAHLGLQLYDKTAARTAYRDCLLTQDWREVVARDDIDAVVISTPDHWHVLPSIAAAQSGKDVFCEKPVSLTVREGRVLSDTIRRYGRVFECGGECRTMYTFHRACELVRNGRIGTLQTIRVAVPGGHGTDGIILTCNPQREQPPPGFDYDMWLGPAPAAPFSYERCSQHFRFILDYSGGNLTDLGVHYLDIAQWGNGTDQSGPVRIEGRGVFPRDGLFNAAVEWDLTYEYANGVKLCFASGPDAFVRFEGAEGWVQAEYFAIKVSSDALRKTEIAQREVRLRTCREGEQRDFLNCVKNRTDAMYPVEEAHRSAALAHLGNIALELGRPLSWDPVGETFPNDDEANRLLARAMRSPWHLDA